MTNATTLATTYPVTDFFTIFIMVGVLANVVKVNRVVYTVTPNFVNNSKQIGAIKYLYLKVSG